MEDFPYLKKDFIGRGCKLGPKKVSVSGPWISNLILRRTQNQAAEEFPVVRGPHRGLEGSFAGLPTTLSHESTLNNNLLHGTWF